MSNEIKWQRIASITIDLEAPEGAAQEQIDEMLDDLGLGSRLLRQARHELAQVGGVLAGIRAVNRHD